MSTVKPEILIVGGGWHTPQSYAKIINAFKHAGYEVHCPRHQSVTSARPPVAGLKEDSANMRAFVEDLLASGKKLVAIAHSYGGQVASNSLYDQSVESRAARGLSGGIVRLVYMCAFALEEGRSSKSLERHWTPTPWPVLSCPIYLLLSHVMYEADRDKVIDQVTEAGHADLMPIAFKWADDMTVLCADPRLQLLGEGPSDDEANEYLSTLDLWNGQCMHDKLEHSAWRELPVAYVSSFLDACVPRSYQVTMIDKIKATGKEVPVLELPEAGHSPNLTHPKQIVELVRGLPI